MAEAYTELPARGWSEGNDGTSSAGADVAVDAAAVEEGTPAAGVALGKAENISLAMRVSNSTSGR